MDLTYCDSEDLYESLNGPPEPTEAEWARAAAASRKRNEAIQRVAQEVYALCARRGAAGVTLADIERAVWDVL